MKEEAVADFVGRYAPNPKAGVKEEPDSCRIVMSKRRLVIAGSDDRLTIPLSEVVDVVVGNVPPDLRDICDDTVTVGYRENGTVETVLVEGEGDTMRKFSNVLFKALLNGAEGVTKHPARVGGRVTDADASQARLAVGSRSVDVRTPDDSFEIDLSSVVDFDRSTRAPGGTERPTILVNHVNDGTVLTSLLSPDSRRKLNLLGRYLRIEYGQLMSEIDDITLSDPEKQVLITVYATGGDIDFGRVLDGNAAQATNVLNSLRKKELIDEHDDGISLTSEGQIIATHRLEDVNM
jgi:helix-turn-helix protein